ncbi:MAG: hypothetical protein WCP89_04745 [archaeon]
MKIESSKKIIIILLVIVFLGLGVWAGFSYFVPNNSPSFDVDSVLIKSNIKVGGSYETEVRVTNLKNSPQNFSMFLSDVGGLIKPINQDFVLLPSEARVIKVALVNLSASEGVYLGVLEFLSNGVMRTIPIILEIESDNILFDSSVSLVPSGLAHPGERVNAEIKVTDFTFLGLSSVEFEYFVRDFYGNKIFFEKEIRPVDKDTLFTKSFEIPKDAKQEDYVLSVIVRYPNSTGTSSSFFSVEKKLFFSGAFDNMYSFVLLIFAALVLVLLLFIFYSVYSRDKLLDELKTQYRNELKRQIDYIHNKEHDVECKLKTREEKRVSKKIFASVKKERVKAIKKLHKERQNKYKQMKKLKKPVDKMKSQIDMWKKEGYNTSVLQSRTKIPSVEDIRKQIGLWKKRGYDTGVLRD